MLRVAQAVKSYGPNDYHHSDMMRSCDTDPVERCRCIHINHAANGGDGRCKNRTEQHRFCGPCQSEGAVDCRVGEWRLAPYETSTDDQFIVAFGGITCHTASKLELTMAGKRAYWWMPLPVTPKDNPATYAADRNKERG
jgi:hypothetical protein